MNLRPFSKHCAGGPSFEILWDQSLIVKYLQRGSTSAINVQWVRTSQWARKEIWPFCWPAANTLSILMMMMMMISMPAGMWSAWWLPCNGETWANPWHCQVAHSCIPPAVRRIQRSLISWPKRSWTAWSCWTAGPLKVSCRLTPRVSRGSLVSLPVYCFNFGLAEATCKHAGRTNWSDLISPISDFTMGFASLKQNPWWNRKLVEKNDPTCNGSNYGSYYVHLRVIPARVWIRCTNPEWPLRSDHSVWAHPNQTLAGPQSQGPHNTSPKRSLVTWRRPSDLHVRHQEWNKPVKIPVNHVKLVE